MKYKSPGIFVLFSILFISGAFASDTTRKRKPALFSVYGGITNNNVYGSMIHLTWDKDPAAQVKNRQGYTFGFGVQQQLSPTLFYKTGLGFIKKQAAPQENTSIYYKDSLNTGYLSLPLALGSYLAPLGSKKLNFFIELGPSLNFRLADRSYFGADRQPVVKRFATVSMNAGGGLSVAAGPKCNLVAQYAYLYDLTGAYVVQPDWDSNQSFRKYVYAYKTHSLSFSLQWAIRK